MKNSNEILIEFNNIKEKFYDESVIEMKIIDLESNLKKTLSENEKFLFEQISLNKQILHNLKDLRLIDYIKNQP